MAALTRRQIDILRIISDAKQVNVREIARQLGSPNRLSGDLVELIQKRCLHMEHEGKEHIYSMTKLGTRTLAAHEVDVSRASMDRLRGLDPEDVKGLQQKIQELELAVHMLQETSKLRAGVISRDQLLSWVEQGQPSGGAGIPELSESEIREIIRGDSRIPGSEKERLIQDELQLQRDIKAAREKADKRYEERAEKTRRLYELSDKYDYAYRMMSKELRSRLLECSLPEAEALLRKGSPELQHNRSTVGRLRKENLSPGEFEWALSKEIMRTELAKEAKKTNEKSQSET